MILHSPPTTLAGISDSLWTPLFENCQAQEGGTRNVAADCLGQITIMNPAKYLPQLQGRLSSDSRHTRATVIAAIRFTFTNDSPSYDELLAPLIAEFFKLIHDVDLVRLSLLPTSSDADELLRHRVFDDSRCLPSIRPRTTNLISFESISLDCFPSSTVRLSSTRVSFEWSRWVRSSTRSTMDSIFERFAVPLLASNNRLTMR